MINISCLYHLLIKVRFQRSRGVMDSKIIKTMAGTLIVSTLGIGNVQADVSLSMRDGSMRVFSAPLFDIAQSQGVGMVFNSESKLLTYYDNNRNLMVKNNIDSHCQNKVAPMKDRAKAFTEKMMKKDGLTQLQIDNISSGNSDVNVEIVELGSGGKVAGFDTKLVKVMVDDEIAKLLWLSNDKRLLKETQQAIEQLRHMDPSCGADDGEVENSAVYRQLMLKHAMLKSYSDEVAASLEDESIDYIVSIKLDSEGDQQDFIEEVVLVSFDKQGVSLKKGLKQVSMADFMDFSVK